MATLRQLASVGNGYDMGGTGVEKGGGGLPSGFTRQPDGTIYPYDPAPGHLGSPPGVDWNSGWQGGDESSLIGGSPTVPTPTAPQPPAWQHPMEAFGPNVSQNAPRLFQDPTTGNWTLSEHGNFRNVPTDQLTNAQGYVSQFWSQNPNGFIQPGAPGYQPGQAMSNEQYGQPANWQSLWTNAGLQPGTMNPLAPAGGGDTGMNGGTLAELSNPERVNQLSASSYGDNNPFLVR